MQNPSTRRLRLALAGGGTGGHILPGRHLAEHALAAGELDDLVWFQTGRAVEATAMGEFGPRLGERFERRVLRLEPMGGGAPSLFELSLRSLPALIAARAALRRHGSQVLLGLGGYTTLPVVLAARSLGLPIALLEINAVEGRATRWLARFARRVFHAWPGTLPDEREGPTGVPRDLWTGPPLARAFEGHDTPVEGDPEARVALGLAGDRPLLLVLGGSQGALGLNRFLAAHAALLLERGVQVLHQTGPGRLEEAATAAPGYLAAEFVDDVPLALRAATLVLCRGGASTLAEVGALRRPAWVVPYPHHADRHQERNARQLGAGVRIVAEAELDEERARELARLCGPAGREPRTAMSAALIEKVPSDGARRIWSELFELAESTPTA